MEFKRPASWSICKAPDLNTRYLSYAKRNVARCLPLDLVKSGPVVALIVSLCVGLGGLVGFRSKKARMSRTDEGSHGSALRVQKASTTGLALASSRRWSLPNTHEGSDNPTS